MEELVMEPTATMERGVLIPRLKLSPTGMDLAMVVMVE